jgi:hypothetical protein
MRKFTFFTLFFLICLSLFGQAVDEKRLYILPIDGYGKVKDNDYFYKQLTYEVFFQYHTVVEKQESSNYIFKGTIEPVSGVPLKEPIKDPNKIDEYGLISERANPPVKNTPGRREYFSIEKSEDIYFIDPSGDVSSSSEVKIQQEEQGYYFILELLDTETGEPLGRKKILFAVTDASVSKLISVVVYDLLSNIPEITPNKRGDSRDRWLYFDTTALWIPSVYYDGYKEINFLGFGIRLGVEFHFMEFMSLGMGIQINPEQVASITGIMLEAPIALKWVFKMNENYALEPYAGAAFNYSLENKIHPSKFLWFAGFQFGIKDKSETGMIIIDPRFSMDFYNSSIPDLNIEYKRYCFQLGIGYKFGFIQKRNAAK